MSDINRETAKQRLRLHYEHGSLEMAIALAVLAHAGVTDKQGQPYILHPLRVMERTRKMMMLTPYAAHDAMSVAVLHDVVEDTEWTFDNLRELGFSDKVVDAVESVTKRKGENYVKFVRRSAKNEIGRIVKLADVQDNHSRIPTHLESSWWGRLALKYTVAEAILRDDDLWLEANKELVAGMEAA